MHVSAFITLAASLFSAVSAYTIPVTPSTGDKPDPSLVTIGNITHGGSGCPQGTVSKNFNADRTAFTLIFDSYIASIGAGVPLTESRKNCQLNVDLRIPQGWQYSLGTVDYRGYWDLDTGVVGTSSAIYYFQGEFVQCRKDTRFVATEDTNNNNYVVRDVFPLQSLVWSPCGASANLNIGTSINLRGRGSGLLTVDSVDGKVQQVYGLQWRKCSV
ncbi:hypothetical protein HDV05_003469 [Chytridiales sp. JEL 0842]|nr:hypothetical protein HDV05_003469 [Chytridiales sp. JEL 0842]